MFLLIIEGSLLIDNKSYRPLNDFTLRRSIFPTQYRSAATGTINSFQHYECIRLQCTRIVNKSIFNTRLLGRNREFVELHHVWLSIVSKFQLAPLLLERKLCPLISSNVDGELREVSRGTAIRDLYSMAGLIFPAVGRSTHGRSLLYWSRSTEKLIL
jgi:hypothetical protein